MKTNDRVQKRVKMRSVRRYLYLDPVHLIIIDLQLRLIEGANIISCYTLLIIITSQNEIILINILLLTFYTIYFVLNNMSSLF